MARQVLEQYAQLIRQRRQKVSESAAGVTPKLRTGWLLWQRSLREFLYFEHEMTEPDPDAYYAVWRESGGGARKTSKNLWVYEVETRRKRYSITTTAGAKIQPYFDVPAPDNRNLYYFCVQGEEVSGGLVRIWLTSTTAILLQQKLGGLETKRISSAIIQAAKDASGLRKAGKAPPATSRDVASPIVILEDAYKMLCGVFPGVSDEHRMQLFIRFLLSLGGGNRSR